MPRVRGDEPPTVQCGEDFLGDHDNSSSGTSSGTSSSSSSEEERTSRSSSRRTKSRRHSKSASSRSRRARDAASSSESDYSESEDEAPAHRGRSKMSSAAAGKVHGLGAAADLDDNGSAPTPLNWQKRVLVFRFQASPEDLASGAKQPTLDLKASNLFDGATHLVGDVKVLHAKNDLPVTVHMSVDHLVGADNIRNDNDAVKSFAVPSGTSGMLTLTPGETLAAPVTVYKVAQSVTKNSFLAAYPGYTAANLAEDLVFNPHDNAFLVPKDHPLIALYNLKSPKLKLTSKNSSSPNTHLVAKKIVDSMLMELGTEFGKQVPSVDLNGMEISFARAFGTPDNDGQIQWNDPEELLTGVKESFWEHRKTEAKALTLKLQVSYRDLTKKVT